MNEPSERIRAALRKSPGTRATEATQDEESKSQLPDVAISAENLEALLAAEPDYLPPAQAVEALLPMLSSSDEQRLRTVEPEQAHPARPLIPEHTSAVVPPQEPAIQKGNAEAPVAVDQSAPASVPKSTDAIQLNGVSAASETRIAERPTPSFGSTLFAEGPTPPSEEELARKESRKQFIRWIAPGIVMLLLAGGVATYLLVSRQSSVQKVGTNPGATSVPPSSLSSQPLQLDVELQTNGQISVRWNPAAEKVAKAKQGRLTVTEDNQPARVMQLTREQLGIGHFSYQPSGERMEFRLEVVDTNGVAAQESVLAMSPRAAAAPTALRANIGADTKSVGQTSTQAPVTVAPSNNPPVSAPVRNAARAFSPPVKTGGQEVRTIILEPPTIAGTAATGALPTGITTPQSFSPISAMPPPAPGNSAPQQIRVGGNIQSGLLIKRVTPDYPPMARTARVQGTVRFSAVIGKDGRIRDLQLAGGPQLLIAPATAAVKQWVYRPTMLNGQPVEVATQIEVNFTLGQR